MVSQIRILRSDTQPDQRNSLLPIVSLEKWELIWNRLVDTSMNEEQAKNTPIF